MNPSVSVVIVNFNSGGYLARCLMALEAATNGIVTETIVVDNASTDGSLGDALANHPAAQVVRNDRNRGPGVARNQGASIASGDLLLFVDPDVVMPAASVVAMARALDARPGVVAPALYSAAHHRMEYGGTIDLVGHSFPLEAAGSALYVSASVMLTPRTLFDRLNGFDSRILWGEEVDYCWRVLLAGGDITVLPSMTAHHACGGSTPGGYARGGRLETTAFRLLNRERAALTALLTCAPPLRLVWGVPMFAGYTTVLAAGALILGRRDVSNGLLHGMLWNAREFSKTLRRRRSTPRTRLTERRAASRIETRLFAFRLLVDHGIPLFVDRVASTRPKPALVGSGSLDSA